MEELPDTDDRLRRGDAVPEARLDLLERPDEIYRRLNGHGRRLPNQAISPNDWWTHDRDDRAIQITGQICIEPFRDLLTAIGAPSGARATAACPTPATQETATSGTPCRLRSDRESRRVPPSSI